MTCCSLPKRLQKTGLCQVKVRQGEPHLGLLGDHLSGKDSSIWAIIHCLIAHPCNRRKTGTDRCRMWCIKWQRNLLSLLSFKKKIFLFERQILQSEKKKNFHLLLHSSNDHSGWRWVDQKPGGWSFFQVCHVVQGPKDMTQPPLLFQVYPSAVAGLEVEEPGHKLSPLGAAGITGRG